jgi:putative zinc finger/helix-turn-helix YgiT family protein
MTEPIKDLPFPWPCGKCRQSSVERATFRYSAEMQCDGRTYSFEVPELHAPRCTNYCAVVLDDQANDQITDALRREVGLLTPEQIRSNRETLGLKQRDFADRLGVGESTVSRWETGAQVQQRSLDKLMRIYFAFPDARDALADKERLPGLGVKVAKKPRYQVGKTGSQDLRTGIRTVDVTSGVSKSKA